MPRQPRGYGAKVFVFVHKQDVFYQHYLLVFEKDNQLPGARQYSRKSESELLCCRSGLEMPGPRAFSVLPPLIDISMTFIPSELRCGSRVLLNSVLPTFLTN